MKKCSASTNRSKPPSVRLVPSSVSSAKVRSSHFIPPLAQESMSETHEMFEAREGAPPVRFSSKEVSDCMSQWLTFLKLLRMLCSSGSELTDSLSSINCGSSACKTRIDKCKAMWDHLRLATSAASSIVTNQAFASLQEAYVTPDIDQDQADINQGVVCSGLLRLLNLQYQFSADCCEWIASMPGCTCIPPHTNREVEAVARCFPEASTTVQVPQRRWSEAAAANRDKTSPDPTLRRWSIPWKLALPSGEKSRSTTPDAVWHTTLASQEELQDVISLLSVRPGNANSPHLPGVVLTKADQTNVAADGSHAAAGKTHRTGSWWGEGIDDSDPGMIGLSRKSSSSTDTTASSCYSLHKSTTSSDESHGPPRSHLYSMWSGGELPFIALPESSEHPDTG